MNNFIRATSLFHQDFFCYTVIILTQKYRIDLSTPPKTERRKVEQGRIGTLKLG